MAVPVTELTRMSRMADEAVRRERLTRRALGLDTYGFMKRMQLFESSTRTLASSFIQRPNPAFDALASVKAHPVLYRSPSAVDIVWNLNKSLFAARAAFMDGAFAPIDFKALLPVFELQRTASLARFRRARDPFHELTRAVDALAAQGKVAQFVAMPSARKAQLFASVPSPLATPVVSPDLLRRVNVAARLLEANRGLVANAFGVSDALRIHNSLTRQFAAAGLDVSSTASLDAESAEIVDWASSPADTLERERRLLLVTIAVETASAADAFRRADFAMGVVHTAAAVYLLQVYWELRRRQ